MKTPQEILKTVFGHGSFRGQQKEIIDHIIAGNNAFVLIPTGGGKSLCYQLPSLIRSGVGIIISPLISLMQDQVLRLKSLNIPVGAINSSCKPQDIRDTKNAILNGTIDIVYISPERLLTEEFSTFLSQCNISLFAIDEAHCISQWGHDFRPDYFRLSILSQKFASVPRVAFTATADIPTRRDILEKLDLQDGKIFISSFDRPNIQYCVEEKQNPTKQVLQFLKQYHHNNTGIIYCLSRKKSESVQQLLVKHGYNAILYHAGLTKKQRQVNQLKFTQEENIIVVATVAFGMGIDKQNVRFVIHLDLSHNIESYYQETGRAGRDGENAIAWMLYGMKDVITAQSFIDNSLAAKSQKYIQRQKLTAILGYCESTKCRRQILLDYFNESSQSCNNCDNCLYGSKTIDGLIPAQKIISCIYRTSQRFGVTHIIDILLGNATVRIQKFNHHQLKTFAVGQEYTKQHWNSFIRQMVSQGILKIDLLGYGNILLTADAYKVLKSELAVQFRYIENKTKKNSKVQRKKIESLYKAIEQFSDADKKIYRAIRDVRSRLAQKNGCTPFLIFQDRTIVELTQMKPQTLDNLSSIYGIGEKKIQQYGEDILNVILQFV